MKQRRFIGDGPSTTLRMTKALFSMKIFRGISGLRRWTFHHSIKFKILSIFIPSFLLALGIMAYTNWLSAKESHIAKLTAQLELIAGYGVRRINTTGLISLTAPEMKGTEPHRQLVGVLNRIQREFNVDNALVIRRMEDGTFSFVADGNNQFKVMQKVGIHRRFPETARAARAAWKMKGIGNTQLFGSGRYEYLQLNRAIEHEGRVVGLLMLNKFAEDVDQAIRMETLNMVVLTLVILFGGVAVFWMFFSRVVQPLDRLKVAANRVASGDLELEIPPLKGRDEVSLLNESFRTMVRDLRENRAELERNHEELKRTLARVRIMEDLEKNLVQFLPQSVRTVLRSDPEALDRGKTEKDVTVLFLDVEGSTKLTEIWEASQIDHLIQEYFSRYLDFIYENQGDITETAGDGLMIIFQEDDPNRHAFNAVKTATAIQLETLKIHQNLENKEEGLRINIGINSGRALVGFTKYKAVSGSRFTFTATGRTTIVASRLEGLATNGSILVSGETLRRIHDQPEFTTLGWKAESLGLQNLKNLSEPQPVFRIETPSAS